jgi:O-antigen chain-terminating methyltransferase
VLVDAKELRARLARVLPERRPEPPQKVEQETPRRPHPPPDGDEAATKQLEVSLSGLEEEVLEQGAAMEALAERVGAIEKERSKADEAAADHERVTAQLGKTAKSLSDAHRKLDQLTKRHSALAERVDELLSEDHSGVTVERLKKELGKVSKKLRLESKELLATIEARIAEAPAAGDAEEQLQSVRDQLSTVEKTVSALSVRVSEAGRGPDRVKGLKRRVTALEELLELPGEIEALGRRTAKLETVGRTIGELEQRTAELEAAGATLGRLERNLASLSSRVEVGTGGVGATSELRERVEDLETRLGASMRHWESESEKRQSRLAERLLRLEGDVSDISAGRETAGDVAERVEDLSSRVTALAERREIGDLEGLEDRVNTTIGNIVERIARLEEQTSRVEGSLESAQGDLERTASGLASLSRGSVGVQEDLAQQGFRYYAFEDVHRGPSEVVKQRQQALLGFFQQCRDVLDVGCGRGEFLELAVEHGIGARGIDVDEDMVLHCQRKGLQVERAEAVSYLSGLTAKSLDGIVAAHVLEHMGPIEVLRFLKLAYDRLKFGTHLVVETVNPLSLYSLGTAFYLDPTHARPIHPEMLQFMLQVAGFRDSAVTFEFPFDTEPLPELEAGGDHLAMTVRAVRQIQQVVFGPRDYFVHALK